MYNHSVFAFLQSLFFIFIAEMGDKSQLVSLTFATRFSAKIVILGIFVSTLLVHLFSVILGNLLGIVIPQFWVNIAAGLAFILFGLWTLRGDELEEGKKERSGLGPFLTVAITFFLAELGDKTMLATITLASQSKDFVGIWLGSTIGMVAADALAIYIGRIGKKKLPEKAIKLAAGIIFILTGIWTIGSTLI